MIIIFNTLDNMRARRIESEYIYISIIEEVIEEQKNRKKRLDKEKIERKINKYLLRLLVRRFQASDID